MHRVVDGRVGREAADYLERTVRMRPLAWGDSFGFRQVVTRSRDVTEPGQLAGLKIRTIQSPIYVKAVELMGASPTPMAFGEVYTSLQTGVIDGYEHDASTTLQQRFYEVAHHMTRTRHIAGVLGLFASTAGLARLPPGMRAALEQAAALDAARRSARDGPAGGRRGAAPQLAGQGMTIRDIDIGASSASRPSGSGVRVARARRRPLARGDPRVTAPAHARAAVPRRRPIAPSSGRSRSLVVAQAAVVGLQVVAPPRAPPAVSLDRGDRAPAAGVADVRRRDRRRSGTASIRGSPRSFASSVPPAAQAIDRGLRLVLLAFLLWLVGPAWRLTVASAGERLAASGLSGATISAVLPVSLVLMAAVLVRQTIRDGLAVWRDRESPCAGRSAPPASRWHPSSSRSLLDAAPLAVLVSGFLVTAALGVPLAFTLALTSLTYLLGIGGVEPDHPADQDPRRRRLVRPARDPAVHPRRRADGVRRHLRTHRRSRDGHRRARARRAGDGRGRRRDPLLGHLRIHGGRRVGDQLAARAVDAQAPATRGAESVSVVAAASAMGILVPPCLTMVVLGSLVNLSIVTLFLAGFVPAFVLAAVLLGADRDPRAPSALAGEPARDAGRSLARASAARRSRPGLPVMLFGGIFSGADDRHRGGAARRRLRVRRRGWRWAASAATSCVGQLAGSGVVTATTLWVLAAASAFAWILVREWVPQLLGEWIAGIGAGSAGLMAMTIVLFVVIGALLEGLPGAPHLRADPVPDQPHRRPRSGPLRDRDHRRHGHRVLPPAGRRRAVDRRRASPASTSTTSAGRIVPYLVALLVGLALIAAFPWMTLVLPRLWGYRG